MIQHRPDTDTLESYWITALAEAAQIAKKKEILKTAGDDSGDLLAKKKKAASDDPMSCSCHRFAYFDLETWQSGHGGVSNVT